MYNTDDMYTSTSFVKTYPLQNLLLRSIVQRYNRRLISTTLENNDNSRHYTMRD